MKFTTAITTIMVAVLISIIALTQPTTLNNDYQSVYDDPVREVRRWAECEDWKDQYVAETGADRTTLSCF